MMPSRELSPGMVLAPIISTSAADCRSYDVIRVASRASSVADATALITLARRCIFWRATLVLERARPSVGLALLGGAACVSCGHAIPTPVRFAMLLLGCRCNRRVHSQHRRGIMVGSAT
jgi:hypothetical protein